MLIAPSVLAADMGNLNAECQRMMDSGADWLHMGKSRSGWLGGRGAAFARCLHPRVAFPLDSASPRAHIRCKARLGVDTGNHKQRPLVLTAVHISRMTDVMDGHFVPNIVLGAPIISSVSKAVPNIFMDVSWTSFSAFHMETELMILTCPRRLPPVSHDGYRAWSCEFEEVGHPSVQPSVVPYSEAHRCTCLRSGSKTLQRQVASHIHFTSKLQVRVLHPNSLAQHMAEWLLLAGYPQIRRPDGRCEANQSYGYASSGRHQSGHTQLRNLQ